MTQRPSEDPIELLREQIRAATDAAERLVRETVPPPRAASPRPPGRSPGPGSSSSPQPPGGSGEPPASQPPGGSGEPPASQPPGGSGEPPGSPPPSGSGPSPPPDAGQIPPSGWDTPETHREAGDELQALQTLFQTVRELLPEDIQHQVTELIRQLLLLLRALIDWAVSRIEGGPRGREVQVEDIPII